MAYGIDIWEWLFWMGTTFAKLLQEHSWICHITRGFATCNMTNSLVLLQKLCKNCPHPEKLHFSGNTECLCFHYWDFWHNNWRSIIDVVERLCFYIRNNQKKNQTLGFRIGEAMWWALMNLLKIHFATLVKLQKILNYIFLLITNSQSPNLKFWIFLVGPKIVLKKKQKQQNLSFKQSEKFGIWDWSKNWTFIKIEK